MQENVLLLVSRIYMQVLQEEDICIVFACLQIAVHLRVMVL